MYKERIVCLKSHHFIFSLHAFQSDLREKETQEQKHSAKEIVFPLRIKKKESQDAP